MTWAEECAIFLRYAKGDLAVFVGLCALRKTEHGGPGKELGVLSVSAPRFEDQVRIAAMSFRNSEQRAAVANLPAIRHVENGLYTEHFLAFFSARWAPVTGATNDPHGLNANHTPNLVKFYIRFAIHCLAATQTLPEHA